ncbi:MAG: hypothetical protein M0R46_08205 [Candidatus Muirbacterium halophilum]|nr:hypothetical protein [Candidatus Muirbacterium halophilum]MCK9475885.1 hypothetical protein [Candidatus Muirbacterium halophilum]
MIIKGNVFKISYKKNNKIMIFLEVSENVITKTPDKEYYAVIEDSKNAKLITVNCEHQLKYIELYLKKQLLANISNNLNSFLGLDIEIQLTKTALEKIIEKDEDKSLSDDSQEEISIKVTRN